MYENIIWSLGVVRKKAELFSAGTLGTCFTLGAPNRFFTAAHCVESLTAEQLEVHTIGAGSTGIPVTRIVKHTSADIALLTLDLQRGHHVEALSLGNSRDLYWGAHVAAFGFPMDTIQFGNLEDQLTWTGPTPRFLGGHIQRNSVHVSALGYKYYAKELSFAAPSGLSGGPVFLAESMRPVGLVTENYESTTFRRSITEVSEPGHEFRETVHAVVNYAICLSLEPLRNWLNVKPSDG